MLVTAPAPAMRNRLNTRGVPWLRVPLYIYCRVPALITEELCGVVAVQVAAAAAAAERAAAAWRVGYDHAAFAR